MDSDRYSPWSCRRESSIHKVDRLYHSICPVGTDAKTGLTPFEAQKDVTAEEEGESPVKYAWLLPADIVEHIT